tara:strand:- start:119 stop:514 length:396 start_codon:yes stop_codon:yes gene_type:complete
MVLFVFLFLVSLTEKAVDGDLIQQKILSENLAMLHDSVVSGDGDISYTYKLDKGYTVFFTVADYCSVTVLALDEKEKDKKKKEDIKSEGVGSSSFCIKTKADTFGEVEIVNAEKIIFTKKDGVLEINGDNV